MRFVLGLVLWLVLSSEASAFLLLNGCVYEDTEPRKLVVNTRIGVASGPGTTTDSKGQYSITVSSDFIAGERVVITVMRPGWVVNDPVDGDWNLPDDKHQNVQTKNVIIVPKGSKKLWSNQRIEKYIARLSDEVAKWKKRGLKPKQTDLTPYTTAYAKQFEFTVEQVRETFSEWAKKAENSEDNRTRALAEFYRGDLKASEKYFTAAALEHEKAPKKQARRIYENWKDAGNSALSDYRFAEAIDKYDRSRKWVSKEQFPYEWAEIRLLSGSARRELGQRAEGNKYAMFMKQAHKDFSEALEVFTRKDFPQDWARTQNSLALLVIETVSREPGSEGLNLLNNANTALHSALEVITRTGFPEDWATIQNNIGIILSHRANRSTRSDGLNFLNDAATALHSALEVFTRNGYPEDWARSQNTLGSILCEQAELTEGSERITLLKQAIAAHRSALEVRTVENLPQDWARTQDNLAGALCKLGRDTGGSQGAIFLSQAVDAYREALKVRTFEHLPQDWARTQNGLGLALYRQGILADGQDRHRSLGEAVIAYRESLKVRTLKHLPQSWASTQGNLSMALLAQAGKRGQVSDDERKRLIKQSIAAVENALSVHTKVEFPRIWATLNELHGLALTILCSDYNDCGN